MTPSPSLPDPAPAGFNFENYYRNQSLSSTTPALKAPSHLKTGTTICGIIYKNGIILGADTRATAGEEVADKNCEKIHYIADNIYCCGAGTAADTEKTTELIASQLELLRMNAKQTKPRVVTACTLLKRLLFRYQGHIGAALVLGGVDSTGPHLYQIYPHGSTSSLPYVTMGSGSLAAMAVFETGWKEDMEEAEGLELVKRAIMAGVWNDLGSGSNCDTCIIRNDGTTENTRGAVTPVAVDAFRSKITRSERLTMKKGTTKVLKEEYFKNKAVVTLADVTVTEMET